MPPKYSKQAERFLVKIDKKTALRLITAINELPSGDVKKLRGFKNLYRLRIGDIRVTFTCENGQIFVDEIDFRGSIY